MNIATVMDQLGAALGSVDGVRVFPYSADRITPPAAIVGWPDPIEYDTTMARGADRLTMPVWLVVDRLDARTSRDKLSAYLAGSGDRSIKAAVEGWTYTALHSVRVMTATVDSVSVAGVDYLAANFQVDVIGPGGA